MTPQSEKESNIKQLGRLPYGGCPKALPFCLLVTEAVPQPFRKALAFLVVLVAQRRIKFPQLILLGVQTVSIHLHGGGNSCVNIALSPSFHGWNSFLRRVSVQPVILSILHCGCNTPKDAGHILAHGGYPIPILLLFDRGY